MSMSLSNFLIEVSQNPGLFQKLQEDPEGVAAESGLSSEELAALLSEDQREVCEVLYGHPWWIPVFIALGSEDLPTN